MKIENYKRRIVKLEIDRAWEPKTCARGLFLIEGAIGEKMKPIRAVHVNFEIDQIAQRIIY